MPIDFYYALASIPCRSVLLLAKNLGIELNLKTYTLDQIEGEQIKSDLRKINPQHCVPTIVDNGFALWESRAILCYLVENYAKDDSLFPKDPKKRAIVNQRLYFDIGTLYPKQMEHLRYIVKIVKGDPPTEEMLAKYEEGLQLLDKFLEEQDWIAGNNITIADYSIVITIALLDLVGQDLSKYKNIPGWYARVKKAIKGYDEIQNAAAIELKKYIAAHSHQ